jgi:hypothetical protein
MSDLGGVQALTPPVPILANSSTPPPSAPWVGAWVVDTRSDRLAVVTDVLQGRLYLRRPRGGVEWDALPVHIRPATSSEILPFEAIEGRDHG